MNFDKMIFGLLLLVISVSFSTGSCPFRGKRFAVPNNHPDELWQPEDFFKRCNHSLYTAVSNTEKALRNE